MNFSIVDMNNLSIQEKMGDLFTMKYVLIFIENFSMIMVVFFLHHYLIMVVMGGYLLSMVSSWWWWVVTSLVQ